MASTGENRTDAEYGKDVSSSSQPVPQPVPPSTETSWFKLDVLLRVLLFAATVTSLVVLVTSKQTIRTSPRTKVEIKFNNSPAFIYFLVALSVAGLYSIVTTLASISVVLKPQYSTKFSIHFVFWDVLILGVLASATGTAGGIAYVGLKGNDDIQWRKVCNVFDKFCRHIGASLGVSLFASFLLVFLIWLNVCSLHKKIPK